jgi:hypothetical protein
VVSVPFRDGIDKLGDISHLQVTHWVNQLGPVFAAPNRLIRMIAGIMENADDVAGNILGVKHARGRKNDIMDCNEVDMEWVNRIMKQ